MHLFVFGFGYSAQSLASRVLPKGWRVSATCRTDGKARDLAGAGIEIHQFDSSGQPAPEIADWLAEARYVLSSVPPGEEGDPVLRHFGKDLKAAAPHLRWVGYLSTTGVYGDRGGAWVDERTVPTPGKGRSQRRAEAEAEWLKLWSGWGVPVHIFRLAGIYGPGRNALEQVRAGTAKRIVKPGQVFSRIHVADIAAVLEASMAAPAPGEIYNVCDDEAAPPQDVVRYASKLLHVPPPPEVPFGEAELSPMARSFYADNRRVSNAKIKRELGVELAFPTYREGLKSLAAALDEPAAD